MDISENESIKDLLSEKEYTLRKERGERALAVRKALKLSRNYLKNKYQIPASTLQSWEDVNFGGMGDNAALRLASIYQAEGINITPEWLMYGIGENPLQHLTLSKQLIKRLGIKDEPTIETQVADENSLHQELKIFYELNPKAVHFIIEDDAMAPWLMPGDYVGGKWYFDEEIVQAIDFPCIAHLETGEKLVRILKAGNKEDCYTLICTNTKTSAPNFIVSNVKLLSAAPIIRLWKPKPSGEF